MPIAPHPSSALPPARCVVGLGSNLGDRPRALLAGVQALGRLGIVVAVSPIYETAPVGGPSQGAYLNAAALIETRLSLRHLLDGLLSAEASLGRVRRERWAARVLDLDLLWAEGCVAKEPGLEVPHPRLPGRAFALAPLLDLVPRAQDPRTGEPYAAALGRVTLAGVRRWDGNLPAGTSFQ